MTQTWSFDPVYTLLLVEEFERKLPGASRAQQLNALGERMLDNMAGYAYLTEIYHGGTRRQVDRARDMAIRLDGDRRLEFRFTLPLAEPVPLLYDGLQYAIFDPTYYIEMLHPSVDAVTVSGPNGGCAVRISEPSPTPAQIARAAAVDLGAASADGLGRHFAQRVTVRCPGVEEAP